MQPRINVITLGVKDLARSKKFYEKLGFKASSISEESFAAFQLGGLILFLFPENLLAEDANLAGAIYPGFKAVALSQNVATKEEVDLTLLQAVQAGALLQKRGQEASWGGYNGYFADPDGHLWEIAYNPFWKLNADGTIQLPK